MTPDRTTVVLIHDGTASVTVAAWSDPWVDEWVDEWGVLQTSDSGMATVELRP